MGNLNINENLGKIVKKAARYLKKLENFLNRKIRAAPLTAAPPICISSELLPLFLFYLAAPRRAALVCNGLNRYRHLVQDRSKDLTKKQLIIVFKIKLTSTTQMILVHSFFTIHAIDWICLVKIYCSDKCSVKVISDDINDIQ